MSVAFLMSLQAAAAAVAPEAVDFDLAKYRPSEARDCGAASAGEILVCGRRRNQEIDPTGELARRYAPHGPIKAEVGLGGSLVGRSYVESAAMPQGQVSKRIMVGVKLPF